MFTCGQDFGRGQAKSSWVWNQDSFYPHHLGNWAGGRLTVKWLLPEDRAAYESREARSRGLIYLLGQCSNCRVLSVFPTLKYCINIWFCINIWTFGTEIFHFYMYFRLMCECLLFHGFPLLIFYKHSACKDSILAQPFWHLVTSRCKIWKKYNEECGLFK